MKNTKKRLILISFALAVISAMATFAYLQSLKTPRSTIKNMTILVANETILRGTIVDKSMIKEIQTPENIMFNDYIKDASKIIGKYTKETILKNEGFNINKLLDKNENTDELSLNIDENNRAISINATGDSGVSRLIKPGDFVDIILYLTEKKDGQKIIRPELAKVIMQNVQILAIDKTLSRNEMLVAKDNEKLVTNFLVTLSVPLPEVEKLVLAENIGLLKLALRPLEKPKNSDSKVITEKELLSTNSKNGMVIKRTDTVSLLNKKNKYKYYKVKHGDTLRNISRIFYGNPQDYILIKEANKINDGNAIIVGKTIKIPVTTKMR